MDPLYMTACWTHHEESYINSTDARQMVQLMKKGQWIRLIVGGRFLQPLIEENVGSSRHKPILRVEPSRLNGFISCLRTLIRSCTLDVRSIKNWKPL
ncbi:PREDICTED: LOC109835142 [Prunus dulcis]|uniref:PREDICTED: LOC109835142 n=1 Tax=Prunus dulcis TaxID=3755 RepID=A0A5E4GIZ1_PRUDU|nr:PREDICTED: LOC109835142 [Prunus dulcis]